MVPFLVIGEHADGSTTTIVPDTVYSIAVGERGFTKPEVELTVAEHFREVACRKYPELQFELEKNDVVRPENASPDFFIRRNGKRIGLDVTDYAFSNRRAADDRFEQVKLAFAKAYRSGRFRLGERMSIWLRFANRNIDFKQIADDMEELIGAVDRILITPGIEAWANQSDVIGPARYPFGEGGITRSGLIEWGVESIIPEHLLFAQGAGWFQHECKFQIKHVFSDGKSDAEIAEELNRVVAKHDKLKPPEEHIDELLIVAGGPDRRGRCLLGEAFRAMYFVDQGGGIAPPHRLTRVLLDCWGLDRVIVLFDRDTALTHVPGRD